MDVRPGAPGVTEKSCRRMITSCLVAPLNGEVSNDQWRCQKGLFLEHVGVHPVRSHRARRKSKLRSERAPMSGREASATPPLAKGGVSPCQWMIVVSSLSFSSITLNASPSRKARPGVPFGWRSPKTLAAQKGQREIDCAAVSTPA